MENIIEKYGNKEPNFENYIEYLEDSEFDKQKSSYQKNAEKTARKAKEFSFTAVNLDVLPLPGRPGRSGTCLNAEGQAL